MQARILMGEQIRVTRDAKEIDGALTAGVPIWIELEQQDHACDKLLADTLHLHPLTIEDIWSDRPAPKVEDYDSYLYVIIHGIRSVKRGIRARRARRRARQDVRASRTIAYHLCDAVAGEPHRNPKLLAKGPAWLAHALLDHVVDEYLPVIDDLDAQIEDLENEVLRKAGTQARSAGDAQDPPVQAHAARAAPDGDPPTRDLAAGSRAASSTRSRRTRCRSTATSTTTSSGSAISSRATAIS